MRAERCPMSGLGSTLAIVPLPKKILDVKMRMGKGGLVVEKGRGDSAR